MNTKQRIDAIVARFRRNTRANVCAVCGWSTMVSYDGQHVTDVCATCGAPFTGCTS